MTAQDARNFFERFGWKRISIGDDYVNGKGVYCMTITTDETNLVRAKWNPSCSQDVFPLEIIDEVGLATICSGGVPAGFSSTKTKVGEAGSLF
jgi:hypothetical protein